MTYETIVYDRNKLYEEVWSEPVREIAKRYKVSDVALAKTCRKSGIPLPPQGYWLRPAGTRGKRPSLPPAPAGERELWETRHYTKAKVVVPPEVEAKLARELAPDAAVIVPDHLAKSHKLVALSGTLLRKQKPYEGFVCCHSSPCLDVRVSLETLDRALRIMHAIICALEVRGLKVEIKPFEHHGYALRHATVVTVDGEELSLALREKYSMSTPARETVPKNLKGAAAESWLTLQRRRVPNGRFALAIRESVLSSDARKTWADSPNKKIETSLNAVVAELYLAAAEIKRRREEYEQSRLRQEDEARRARDQKQRHRAEEQRLKAFQELLVQWHFAWDARALLREVHAMLAVRGLRVSKDGPIEEWLNWVTEQAEKADPLSPLLRDANKMATTHRTWRPPLSPLSAYLRRAHQRVRTRAGVAARVRSIPEERREPDAARDAPHPSARIRRSR